MSLDQKIEHEFRQAISRSAPGEAAGLIALSSLPPALRPLVRAYVTGYATTVGPRLLALIVSHISKKRQRPSKGTKTDETPSFIHPLLHIIQTGFEPHRFPTFCAVVAGGSTLLLVYNSPHPPKARRPPEGRAAYLKPLYILLTRSFKNLSGIARLRLARWISAFVSAWLGLRLLQQRGSKSTPNTANANGGPATKEPSQRKPTPRSGGNTLDLTLFTVTRALDIIVGELWSRHRARRTQAKKWTKAEELTSYLTDPSVFVISSALIMWSWFYYPHNLPRSYQKWITSAANLDMRLIEALRRCKFKELRYGEETGQASLLGGMCASLDMPTDWGDPAKTIPFPCDIVHMKRGQSCESHAVSRLARSWIWSMYTYLPLALAFKVRKLEKEQLLKAFISASRSSLFLGSFITIFYYTICLSRTRIGPYLNGRSTEACQRMDGGICVGMGCGLCGWSILIETASRRKDMALFVGPRALATILPRKYSSEKQYKETLAFAASAAVISTCVLENPKRVRGVFGRLLGSIMRT